MQNGTGLLELSWPKHHWPFMYAGISLTFFPLYHLYIFNPLLQTPIFKHILAEILELEIFSILGQVISD